MIVIGAGMAGLLAGVMLRDKLTSIHERQPELPNNHSAVLRFRSSVVGDTIGVPFKAVQAMKAVHPHLNPVADALSYSRKTNGTYTLRSSVSADGSLSERYIAPPDLIQQMAAMIPEHKMHFGSLMGILSGKQPMPVISTMPMPSLMGLLEWPEAPEFHYREGVNIVADLADVDAYCSLYVPEPRSAAARISITGNRLTVECYGVEADMAADPKWQKQTLYDALYKIGVPRHSAEDWECRPQKYAKITPIDEGTRRRFIMWASSERNVYSLGRFATWRPHLLLDDVVNDVRVIQRLAANPGDRYAHQLRG